MRRRAWIVFVALLGALLSYAPRSSAEPPALDPRVIDVLDHESIKVVEWARDKVAQEAKREVEAEAEDEVPEDVFAALSERLRSEREKLIQGRVDQRILKKLSAHVEYRKILQRLAYVRGFRAATLMWILKPALVYDRAERVEKLVEIINQGEPEAHAPDAKKPCQKLREEAKRSVRGLYDALKQAPKPGDCAYEELSHLDGHRLLHVAGQKDDIIRVLTGGKSPRFFELGAKDRYEAKGGFVFVTPVPFGVPVTVSVKRREQDPPLVWDYFSDHAELLESSSVITGCLDVELKFDAGSYRVFFDGFPIMDATKTPSEATRVVSNLLFVDAPSVATKPGEPAVLASPEPHDLAVLDQASKTVIARRSIPAEDLKKSKCSRREINIQQSRQAHDISITNVRAGPLCVSAGIDGDRLSVLTDQVLGGLRKTPKPFEGWDAMRDGEEMKRLLVTGLDAPPPERRGQGAAPDKRPPADGDYQANEDSTLNTGFGRLVSLELHCYKQNDNDTEYTVVARSLSLGQRNARLADLKAQQIRHAKSRADIRGALRAALGHLLKVPYVRFVRVPAGSFRGRLEYDVEAYLPPLTPSTLTSIVLPSTITYPASFFLPARLAAVAAFALPDSIELWGAELEDDEAAALCGPLETGESDYHPARIQKDVLVSKMDHTRFQRYDWRPFPESGPSKPALSARPARPGTYVFRTCLRHGGFCGEIVTDRCVEVGESRARIWAEIGYAGRVASPVRDARVDQSHVLETALGVSWQVATNQPFWLGFRFGYEREMHTQGALTSWNDLLANRPTPEPGSLSWMRHSVVFGPTFELRGGLCGIFRYVPCRRGARFIEAFGRFTPALDIGFIDASGVPPGLAAFLQGARTVDVDASMKLQLGVTLSPSIQFGTYVAVGLGFRSINDWGRSQEKVHRIDTSAQNTVTLVVGGEFSP